MTAYAPWLALAALMVWALTRLVRFVLREMSIAMPSKLNPFLFGQNCDEWMTHKEVCERMDEVYGDKVDSKKVYDALLMQWNAGVLERAGGQWRPVAKYRLRSEAKDFSR